MLEQAIAIANGKGGVGKSSPVANIAAIAAASNWRVLIVDLDPQGNVGSDLGYKHRGRATTALRSRRRSSSRPLSNPFVRFARTSTQSRPVGTLEVWPACYCRSGATSRLKLIGP